MFKMATIFPYLLSAMLLSTVSAEGAPQESSQLPERDSIPPAYQWHLQDIYENDAAWQADFDKLKSILPQVIQYKGKLAASSQNLAQCLKLRDDIGIISGKLYAYARMHRDENANVSKYLSLTGKAESLFAEAGAGLAFIEPEILAIPDEKLTKFRSQNKDLNEYAFYFENLSRQKKHVLTPAEEEILSRSADVTQTGENAFTMLSTADMRFPMITNDKGQKMELSEGRYHALITSQNRKVREQSFLGLFNTYNQYRNTFAATLGGCVKKNIFYAKTRNYSSGLEAALESDNIPVSVYENLITTVNANLEPLHRYVTLKKKILGLKDIHMYDLYVPMVSDIELKYDYEEGLKLVKGSLAPLGPEYATILDKGLTEGWVDVYENKGKQTGAYSWGVYSVHPFVLLNYHGHYDDVSTIAHEMGHAINSYYSNSSQPYATSEYSTFTAEVASTTNEVLLIDYMLKNTNDKKKKLYLINQYLEAIRATVYRQALFAEFEKIIYEKSEQGETLTADLLDSIWHDLNVKYYGPTIIVDKQLDVEWARIPHFYRNFYVFQYVTGYSAATALADQVQKEGSTAQQRYINFLKSGGSDYPINILKKAGVDMSSPEPIAITLRKFSALLDEMENILNQP